LCGGDYEQTLLAVTRHDDFAVFTPFEEAFEVVQAQISFWPLLAMTTNAGSLEQRLDVFRVREILLGGRWRQFAEVQFAEIKFIGSE
jgi:hypothetical protein